MRFFFILTVFWLFLSYTAYSATLNNFDVGSFQSKLIVYEPVFQSSEFRNLHQAEIKSELINDIVTGDSLFLKGKSELACIFYNKGVNLAVQSNLKWVRIIFLNRLGFVNYWVANISQSYKYYTEAQKIISLSNNYIDTIAVIETAYFNDLLNPSHANIDVSKLNVLINSVDPSKLALTRLIKYQFIKIEINQKLEQDYINKSILANQKMMVNELLSNNRGFWIFITRFEESVDYKNRKVDEVAVNFNNELLRQINTQPDFREFGFYVKMNIAKFYSDFFQYFKAIELLEEMHPIAEKNRHPFFYEYYLWLGYYYSMIGDSLKPEYYYKKAEKLLNDFHISDNRLARVYHFFSSYSAKFDDASKRSLEYSLKAARILENSEFPYLESYIYFKIGSYYFLNKDYSNAAHYYGHMISDIDSILDDDSIFYQQLPKLLIYNIPDYIRWRALSYYYLAKNNNFNETILKKSYDDFNRINKLWKKVLKYIDNYEEFRVSILKSVRESYNNYIDLSFAYYQATGDKSWLDKMFNLSQDSKVFLLNSYVNDRTAQRIAGVPEDSIQKARKMKKELDELQYSQYYSPTNEDLKSENPLLISTIVEKSNEYDQFIKQLEDKYPSYSNQKKKNIGVDRKEIQKKLNNNEALIEYYHAFDGLYIFYLDNKKFIVVSHYIPDGLSIPDSCKRYYELLSQMPGTNNNDLRKKEMYRLSRWLYYILITPIEKDIQGKKLTIVPDLELNLVPFETLIAKKLTAEDLQNKVTPKFLVLTNVINYLYSSSQVINFNHSFIHNARYAGFVPDYSSTNNSISEHPYKGIKELPGAFEEVNTAKEYFKGKIFSKENATKNRFFSSLDRFDIVHLAMHSSIDEKEPMNSELIFNIDSTRQDLQLHAYEVYAHENNLQMAVLSACNTAKGKLEKGEGVINIARAFFLAGIPNVIVTQWSVPDKSSTYLMNGFYKALSEGVPSDVALQRSKKDIIMKGDPVYKDPYYWSAYGCFGVSTFIPPKKIDNFLLFGIAIVLIGTIYFWYRKKFRT